MAFNPDKCLKFKALADNCRIALDYSRVTVTSRYKFSKDGVSWLTDYIKLAKDETCFVKGTAFPSCADARISFTISADAEIVSGNIMSLVDDGAGELNATQPHCFATLFKGCKLLKSIPEGLLPATVMTNDCYGAMFSGCENLERIPEGLLPATTLASTCYGSMFYGCKSLQAIPSGLLPATTLPKDAYDFMFSQCSSLTTVPFGVFPEGITFEGESPLTEMFYGCPSLKEIHVPFTSWGNNSTLRWVQGVAASGEFYAPPELPIIYDISHIPPSWNKHDEDPTPPPPPPPPPPEVHGSAAVVLLGNINIGSTF